MKIADSFKIGFVLKPHGLKGSVTVSLDEDSGVDVTALENVFLDINGNLVPYFIETVSVKGNKAFLKFEEIDTIDEAEAISKKVMMLPKSQRPKSRRGEFYEDEIIGFTVIDEVIGGLGKIEEVVSAGPNKLLMLMHNEREILIPINSPFISGVNKSKRKVTVNLPEGFLDI